MDNIYLNLTDESGWDISEITIEKAMSMYSTDDESYHNGYDGYYDYSTMEESEIRKHLKRTENSYRNQVEARKELKRRRIPVTKKYDRNEFKRGWRDEEWKK